MLERPKLRLDRERRPCGGGLVDAHDAPHHAGDGAGAKRFEAPPKPEDDLRLGEQFEEEKKMLDEKKAAKKRDVAQAAGASKGHKRQRADEKARDAFFNRKTSANPHVFCFAGAR